MSSMYGPPVKVGEEFKLEIEAVGKKDDGIAKINGYTIFVTNGKLGETVNVKITNVREKFAFAEIVKEENNEEKTPEDSEDFGEEEDDPEVEND